MKDFKYNQKQNELYNDPLCIYHYYTNYQLIGNFVLPVTLSFFFPLF